jgi:hypothetical protein
LVNAVRGGEAEGRFVGQMVVHGIEGHERGYAVEDEVLVVTP